MKIAIIAFRVRKKADIVILYLGFFLPELEVGICPRVSVPIDYRLLARALVHDEEFFGARIRHIKQPALFIYVLALLRTQRGTHVDVSVGGQRQRRRRRSNDDGVKLQAFDFVHRGKHHVHLPLGKNALFLEAVVNAVQLGIVLKQRFLHGLGHLAHGVAVFVRRD